MKHLLIILIAILPLAANAQIDTLPWCPPGATWVYTSDIYYSQQRIEYVGDTLLLGRNAKKLSMSGHSFPNLDTIKFEYYFYMAYENDTLFLYRDSMSYYHVPLQTMEIRDNRWEILCVFSGQEGDSWQIKEETNYCDSIDTITIDRIDTTRILAAPFLTEEYILSAQNFTIPSSFYKGIGPAIWYPYQVDYIDASGPPDSLDFCEGNHEFKVQEYLGCYSDSLRGTIVVRNYQSLSFNEGCKMITAIDEVYYKDVEIYPNPAKNSISISNLPQGNYTLSVFDNFGKKVIQDLEWTNNTIPIDELSSGFYYLHIKAETREEKYFKFLKE